MNLKECKIDIDNIMLDIQMILERITTIEDYIKKGQKIESTPIDPGEGYRLLEDDEIIKDTDEFYCEIIACWNSVPVIEEDKMKVSSIVQKIRRKIDTRKYIESADDIVPWQYYITKDGGLCKIYQDMDSSSMRHILDIKSSKMKTEFKEDELIIDFKLRAATTEEIPEHCLIGKVVLTRDDNNAEAEQGIIIDVSKSEDKFKYYVFTFEELVAGWYKNIELIDHPANY